MIRLLLPLASALAACAAAPPTPFDAWIGAAEQYHDGARRGSPHLLLEAARTMAAYPARPWPIAVTVEGGSGFAPAPHAPPAPSVAAALALAGAPASPLPAPIAAGPHRRLADLPGGARALIPVSLDHDAPMEVAALGDAAALWVFDPSGAPLCHAAAAYALRCRWPARAGVFYDVVVRNRGRYRDDVTVLTP